MFVKISNMLHEALTSNRNTELSFCQGQVRGQHVIVRGKIFRILTQNKNKFSFWARLARQGAKVSHVYEVEAKKDHYGKHVGVVVGNEFKRDKYVHTD